MSPSDRPIGPAYRRALAIVGAATVLAGLPDRAAGQWLGPCPPPLDPRWECGSLRVPENRQTNEGRTIDVAVKVRRATGAAGREPIFLFSGGPGAPTATGAQPNLMAAQAATRDLVLIDQRGTGASNGFHCDLDLATEPSRAFGQLYPMDQLARCHGVMDVESDPNQYTTGDFVADVDLVRERLGYSQVVVAGGSYGTRSAMTYMALYPDRVAAAVLNGVMPPEEDAPLEYARSAQFALDRVFADCQAQPACDAAYPRLSERFDELMSALRRAPRRVTVRRRAGAPRTVTMSANDFGYAVRIILYNRNAIPRLPQMLHHAAETGDLSAFAQAHYDRAAAILSFASLGLHFSVFCAEDVPWVREADVAAAVRDTYFGRYLIDQYREGCRRWPIERRDRRSHRVFTTDTPVLLLSGRYDPVTPETSAARIGERFTNSRHFVTGDGGHGASGSCVSAILAEFYDSLDPTRLRDRCADVRSATFVVER